jgi:asparagine synthase (glutamine-hydrolysing)
MCGIVAWWNRDGRPVDVEALRAAVGSLKHRGPDDEGYVLINTRTGRVTECAGTDTRDARPLPLLGEVRGGDYDLALGHRRLAIVDLSSAGHQPMCAAHDANWIVFNGMIHNFTQLRQQLQERGHVFRSTTDTEVILRSYQEWGEACVTHFNGMWAFVLWDQRARRLFASRDHLGIKPLVFYRDAGLAAFASELKALVRLPRVPRRLDPEALHHYLSLMKVPAPFTIYQGISKLQPAHSLVICRESEEERHYWRPTLAPVECTEQDALERIDELLRDSVRLRLLADVPVGSLLSGGIDSSIVTAVAAAQTRRSLKTFNVGFRSLPEFDESPWAEMVASHVKAEHRSCELSFDFLERLPELIDLFDEPFSVSSVMGVYLLARAAAPEVKVLLTGDGGDELFAGYLERYVGVDELWERTGRHVFARFNAERASASTEWVRWERPATGAKVRAALWSLARSDRRRHDDCFNLMRFIFNDAEKRAVYAPEWRARTAGLSTLRWLGSTLPPPSPGGLGRWQLHDIYTSLHDEMLAKVDKATMAWGIEARVPFLDHRLVDLALNLPGRLKVADGHGKWILRKLGERYLPPAVLNRPKHGFSVPLSAWFRGELRTFVRDVLNPSALLRVGVFQPQAVAQVLAYHDARPGFLTSHMVFTLLCFQLWHERQARAVP